MGLEEAPAGTILPEPTTLKDMQDRGTIQYLEWGAGCSMQTSHTIHGTYGTIWSLKETSRRLKKRRSMR